ncbi:hypothetical protein AMECASPLE_008962 [Ameca splendens]|uniref:Uncharacterized protein n=1 Tax=Ameca splendens TaxID=208324 RepID=A0ABV0XD66_9TELE
MLFPTSNLLHSMQFIYIAPIHNTPQGTQEKNMFKYRIASSNQSNHIDQGWLKCGSQAICGPQNDFALPPNQISYKVDPPAQQLKSFSAKLTKCKHERMK